MVFHSKAQTHEGYMNTYNDQIDPTRIKPGRFFSVARTHAGHPSVIIEK